jgi:hypothetical protein
MYFFIQNSEDGITITALGHDDALKHIADLTSEDLRPECRAQFVGVPPNDYSNTSEVCIVQGEIVIPRAVERVTEYKL